MNVYEMFGTDTDLEKDGIALTYGDATIVVARAGGANAKFQKCAESKARPYRAQIQQGVMDPDTAERLLAETFAETVVLGWDNVCDANGDPMEFKRANVVKLFTDLPDLFADVQRQSNLVTNFLVGSREEDAKG